MSKETAKESSVIPWKQQSDGILTMEQLVQCVCELGLTSDNVIEVTGICNHVDITILIDQNEWNGSSVCFIGGYGQVVKTVEPERVQKDLPGILDYYFDDFTAFKVNRLSNIHSMVIEQVENDNVEKVFVSDAEKYSQLAEQLSGIEKGIEAYILSILNKHGRVSLNLTEDEALDKNNFPVTSTLYGRHDTPRIRITDVYSKDNHIYADGIDDDTDEKRHGFVIYREQLSDMFYFIGHVVDMN